MAALRIPLLLLALLAPQAVQAVRKSARQPTTEGTTPVKKVIELLEKLSAQITEEGKQEATQYDKYSCFCKEEADDKLYAITKSEKLIAAQLAEINKLNAEIGALDLHAAKLGTEITDGQDQIQNLTDIRGAEHKQYTDKEADISAAIDACKRAIAALQASKGDMSGKVAFEKTTALLSKLSHSAAAALMAQKQPGESYKYEYHANDIIATLEGLLQTFTATKNRLDLEEFEANSVFDKTTLGIANEVQAAQKEKDETEKVSAFKTEQKQKTTAEKQEEDAALAADKSFLTELTYTCQDKAKEWDSRSTTRAAELTAIAKAMEALQTGVAPNWKANRMLVGLQKDKAPSLLQVDDKRGSHKMKEAVLAALSSSADRLHSHALTLAVLKIRASEDHFEKVRMLIKDIIGKLETMAQAEATHKNFCDKEMHAAISSRDAHAEEIENLEGQITEKEAAKAQLMQEVAALSQLIADNHKALLEATELRNEEHEDNLNVMKEAKIGKDAVEYALKVLKDFYEGQMVLMQKAGYVPPNSDREGLTVGDKEPEIFEDGYKGRQEASKSVIGLLEVILADFDRTGTTVDGQETMSAAEFAQFKIAIEADTQAKETEKKNKEGEIKNLSDALFTLEGQKKTAKTDHELAISELENLRSMCVEGEETYQQRVARRQKEIEALKEAHNILEHWQD